ncbi:MAG: heavy metal translocating P-type ATPase [Crocinitomicaceae bacterium]|nr:heavy metal translocating P-type ATPase [Crocinitomicaceae bacterium]
MDVTQIYKVSGMTCASCASSIESYLSPLDGVVQVSVNYPNQSVAIVFNTELVSIDEIGKKAKEIGYSIIIEENEEKAASAFEDQETVRLKLLGKKLIVASIFSIPIFILSMFLMGKVPYENWILLGLTLPVIFWSGSEFYINAWNLLKRFSSNMDTLVALSTGVAFAFSVFNTIYPEYFISHGLKPHVYYESAVVIITLILLGRFLEERAKGKTSSAIRQLMGLKPKTVTAIRNGEEVSISFNEIQKGELIVLKPGHKVPVDGKVKKGDSFIDESMITGEPIPVHKTKGEKVFAGTINQKGVLRIIAQEIGSKTVLSQIIAMVEKAQMSKPKVQKLADKIAGIFVPIVLVLAVLTFVIWYVYGPAPSFSYALVTFITVLIIACPCALGLATPTALMVGIGKGAQRGILIKDAQALETAYKIDVLILDKTGTITEGKPEVTSMSISQNEEQVKQILLAIESASEHPIADAIVRHLKSLDIEPSDITDFTSITGKGASANYESQTYYVGNESLMQLNNVVLSDEIRSKADKLKADANTLIYIGNTSEVVGLIGVADKVKSSSISAIRQLIKLGVDVRMLTGDHELAAAAIAKQVGITHFEANVLPEEKAARVIELQESGEIVAMAGDGINDSGALAQANVGIAMGSGTDIAMESSDITLMHADLNSIVEAMKLSKATMRTIRQNLFWAFFYNIIAIPVAAGVLYPAFNFLLNPMIAGGAMSLSSISVLLNSLRLKNQS